MANFDFSAHSGPSNIDLGLPSDLDLSLHSPLQAKKDKLARKALDKSIKLGTATKDEFYDADTIRNASNVIDTRLGDPTDSLTNYVDAPERKVTDPLDIAKYNVSRMALDNFAMGTTPATAESFQDIINNPLTPENQDLYNTEMAKLQGDLLDVTGDPSQKGKWGRQIGQVYNPLAPNPEESLKERLLATGNAQMRTQTPTDTGISGFVESALPEDINGSSVRNAVSAFAYTLGEGIANTADLIPETAEFVFGNLIGNKDWKDVKGLYDDEESKEFKEWLGYNYEVLNALGAEATSAVKDAWNKGDYWQLAEVVGKGLATPELIASSLGYVAGMVLPGGLAKKGLSSISGVNKYANALLKADKTGKLTKAEALAKAEKKAGVGYKITKTMAGNVGYVAEAEQFGRDAEDLYKQTYNEDMPIEQRMLVRPLGLLYAKLDALTAKAILVGKDPIAKAIPGVLKKLPEGVKASFAGKVAVLTGAPLARVAGAFGLESGTEGLQTAMEKVAGKYKSGETGVGDVLEEEAFDIGGAALLGGAGGAQMAAPSVVKDAALSKDGVVYEKLSKMADEASERASKVKESVTPNVDTAKRAAESVAGVTVDAAKDMVSKVKKATVRDYSAEPSENIDVKTYVAIVDGINQTDEAVSKKDDVSDFETLGEEKNKELQEASIEFDEVFTDTIESFKSVLAESDEITQESINKGETPVEYGPAIAARAAEAINMLQEVKAEVMSKGAKPGGNKELAMDKKIASLLPTIASTTTKDLTAIVNSDSIDTNTKISAIIGSSNTSVANIKEAKKLEGLTDLQKELLDYRAETAKDFGEVRREKMVGGGAKPGAAQWASTLSEGKDNTEAIKQIDSFTDGQRSKYKKFKEATDNWDKANNMPWVTDGKEYTIDKKAEIRSSVKQSSKDSVVVELADKAYRSIGIVANMEHVLNEEQVNLDKLQAIANSFSEPRKGAKKTQKEVKGKSTKEEVKEAPKASGKTKTVRLKKSTDKELVTLLKRAEDEITTLDKQFVAGKITKEEVESKTSKVHEFIKKVETEQISRVKTSSESHKQPSKAKKEVKKPTTPIEGKKPSKPTIENDFEQQADEAVGAKAEEVKSKPVLDVKGLSEELKAINEDIKWLEFSEADQDTKGRLIINKEIAKLEKRADKLITQLGLEGTIGHILLAKEASKRKKGELLKGEKEVKLANYFEIKKTYNNLHLDLFNKDFDAIKDSLADNDIDTQNFKVAKSLMKSTNRYIDIFVQQFMDQKGISDIDVTETADTEGLQSLTRLLLEGSPGNYKFPKEVTTAMGLAINDWLVNYASSRAAVRTNEDINRLLGRQADFRVTKEEKERLSSIDGLSNTAAASIGGVIYKNLGIKIKNIEGKNREVTEAKFKTELGLTALAAMESNGLIEINTLNSTEIFGKDSIKEGETDSKINTFKMTGAVSWYTNPKKNKFLGIGSRFADKVLATESSLRYPRTKAPLRDRKVRNSSDIGKIYATSKTTEEAVNRQEATEWEWTEGFIDSYLKIVSDDKSRESFKKILGWKNPDDVHTLLKPGVNGKNLEITNNMRYLEEWYEAMKTTGKTSMWFPYKFVKNGRFILDSNTFNPQGKKLHRFAVYTGEHKITKEFIDDHKLALAMAFGIDIDKMSKANSIKEWTVIETKLNKMLDEGKSDLDILEEAVSNKWMHDPEHTLAGIVELKAVNKHIKETGSVVGFDSKLPIETDAITSGFILKILQMPIIKDVKTFLAKGGVFFNYDENTSYGKQAEVKGYADAYNTPAKVMQAKIAPILTELTAGAPTRYKTAMDRATELALGNVTKEMANITRGFMKSPFMVFNYGSGLSAINNSINDKAIESFYEMLSGDKDAIKQALNTLHASGVGMELNFKKQAWSTKEQNSSLIKLAKQEALKVSNLNKESRLAYMLPKALEDNLRSNISAGVGVALERTFKETYGKYIDAGETINNSFTMMFRLFKQKLDKAIDAKEKGLKRHLTDEETYKIVKELEESLPAIKTALGDSTSKMMIFSSEASNYENKEGFRETGQANVRLNKANNKDGKERLSGQAKYFKMVESYSAGAVIPIHFIDGSIQSIVLNDIDALGVHDANLFYANNVTEGTRLYNKGTAKVSTEYSLTNEIMDSVGATLEAASKEEIAEVNKQYSKENKGVPENSLTVENITDSMRNLNKEATEARNQLFSEDIRFEHAAYEGAHFDRKGSKLNERIGSSYITESSESVRGKREVTEEEAFAKEVDSKITRKIKALQDLAKSGKLIKIAGVYRRINFVTGKEVTFTKGTPLTMEIENIPFDTMGSSAKKVKYTSPLDSATITDIEVDGIPNKFIGEYVNRIKNKCK